MSRSLELIIYLAAYPTQHFGGSATATGGPFLKQIDVPLNPANTAKAKIAGFPCGVPLLIQALCLLSKMLLPWHRLALYPACPLFEQPAPVRELGKEYSQ